MGTKKTVTRLDDTCITCSYGKEKRRKIWKTIIMGLKYFLSCIHLLKHLQFQEWFGNIFYLLIVIFFFCSSQIDHAINSSVLCFFLCTKVETMWKFSSGLLHFCTLKTLKTNLLFFKKNGQAFRSTDIQKSAGEFSHVLRSVTFYNV